MKDGESINTISMLPLPADTKTRSKRQKPSKPPLAKKTKQPSSIKSPISVSTSDTQSLSALNEVEIQSIIFKPNTGPQTAFLASSEREVLYGGAAGGGKSYAMLADPLRYISHPQFSGLLLRHTTEELRELVWKSQELYPKIIPGIKWSERKFQWEVPGGGRLWMSYLDRDEDVLRYQGLSFSWIGFDELTQWSTPFAWNYMRSRLRTAASDLPVYMRASTNPGNRGHCVPFGEVLTRNGWVDIRNVVVGDEVLTMGQDRKMFYSAVSDTVKEHYRGVMINKKNQMIFTTNHRLPMRTSNGFDIRPFNELPGQASIVRAGTELMFSGHNNDFVLPEYECRSTKLNQPTQLSNADFCELMGWFISEGHTLDRDKEFGISQTKPHHRVTIENLLDRCGFQYRKTDSSYLISSPSWWNYLQQFGKCRDKFVPEFVKTSCNLDKFFAAVMSGDGHWRKEGDSGIYYTLSYALANDVAEIAVLLGYSVNVNSRQRNNRNDRCYEISVSKTRSYVEMNTGNHIYSVATKNSKINVDKEYFDGTVYCLTVPETEVFFIRQNGYVWLSGNTWVKKMFIDPAPPNQAFWATDIDTGDVMTYPEGHSRAGQPLFKRRFIPAKLSDNPYLTKSGDYETMLLSLPEHQRRQLLEGDWDVAEGAAFPEFKRSIHVVEPYSIPSDWTRFRACDYGYGSFTAVLWFAVAPDESLVVYRELYVTKVLAEDLAEQILKLEAGERIRYGVLDSSCWAKRGDTGPSIAERMILRGCKWRPSDRSAGSRVAGKNEIHRRLQIDQFTGHPRITFFQNCTQTIADLPTIPLDKANPEDVDTKVKNDHTYDAFRYGVMTRPRSANIFDFDPAKQSRGITPVDAVFGY